MLKFQKEQGYPQATLKSCRHNLNCLQISTYFHIIVTVIAYVYLLVVENLFNGNYDIRSC